jgi:adenylosuccinate lyase
MLANLKATKGQVMAESVMMALSRKGLGRQEAHRLVRDLALKARGKDQPLEDVLKGDARVRKLLSQAEVSRAMDPEAYLGESERIVQSVLSKIR